MVETVLDDVRLLRDILLLLTLGDGSSLLGESLLLFSSRLGLVLVEKLDGLAGSVLVQNVLELSNGRRDLQSKRQDLLLSLDSDILGPLDISAKVSLGLNVLTNTERSGSLLEQGVLGGLGAARLGSKRGGSWLLSFGGLCH